MENQLIVLGYVNQHPGKTLSIALQPRRISPILYGSSKSRLCAVLFILVFRLIELG